MRPILLERKTVTREPIRESILNRWIDYSAKPHRRNQLTETEFYKSKFRLHTGEIVYVREPFGYSDISLRKRKVCYKAGADKETEKMVKASGGWHPPTHMTLEKARIFLRITDIRIEHLQDIDEDGARAEGIRFGIAGAPYFSCRDAYPSFWNKKLRTYKLPLYGWNANPWVAVITFERISKEEALGQNETALE